jgi:hypothetical protein
MLNHVDPCEKLNVFLVCWKVYFSYVFFKIVMFKGNQRRKFCQLLDLIKLNLTTLKKKSSFQKPSATESILSHTLANVCLYRTLTLTSKCTSIHLFVKTKSAALNYLIFIFKLILVCLLALTPSSCPMSNIFDWKKKFD